MKRFLLLLILATAVFAGPIQIEIFPMLGPENGPNFDIWATNVIDALRFGPIPSGRPANPTDVGTSPIVTPSDIVWSVGGESWRGTYGIPGQNGSAFYFPVRILSTDVDVTFTLDDVEYRQWSSDPDHWWDWPQNFDGGGNWAPSPADWDSLIGLDFAFYRVGIRASDGAVLDTDSDDRTTPLSALYWIGLPGGGMYAEDPGPGQTYEDMLRLAIQDVAAIGVHRVSTYYRVGFDEGEGDISVVPEPAAGILVLLGLGLVWFGRRLRS